MPPIIALPDDDEPNDQDKPKKAYRAHGDRLDAVEPSKLVQPG